MTIMLKYAVAVGIVSLLLIIILIPLSLSHIEYYEYGIKMRKSTGSITTTKVYGRGRYLIGPDNTFIKYQADAHLYQLSELEVFSSGTSDDSIGLAFKVDIFFTFLLIKDEIIQLHQDLASSYKEIIIATAKEAIKNEAIHITFNEYFENRTHVEQKFRNAVENRWNAANSSLHCTLDQFNLGRIQIPESVAEKQLESKIQNETNAKEKYIQLSQREHDLTEVEVNKIYLEENQLTKTTLAKASLIKVKATVEARQIQADATINGTKTIFNKVGIATEDHMTAFTYIRTLINRDDLQLGVSYLSPDNILRTTSVVA